MNTFVGRPFRFIRDVVVANKYLTDNVLAHERITRARAQPPAIEWCDFSVRLIKSSAERVDWIEIFTSQKKNAISHLKRHILSVADVNGTTPNQTRNSTINPMNVTDAHAHFSLRRAALIRLDREGVSHNRFRTMDVEFINTLMAVICF